MRAPRGECREQIPHVLGHHDADLAVRPLRQREREGLVERVLDRRDCRRARLIHDHPATIMLEEDFAHAVGMGTKAFKRGKKVLSQSQ